jgi:hypothetical protein
MSYLEWNRRGVGVLFGFSLSLTTIFQSIQSLFHYSFPLVIVGFLVQEWLAIFQHAGVVLPLEK